MSYMRIPFCRVLCNGNELSYVQEVLKSGWLTTAGKTHDFESRFAEAVQAEHAVAVNSCTAALHLALEAIGTELGDEVFVPTLTFTASAEVIRYLNAHPILLDVDYATCLLTPDLLKDAIKIHPRAKTLIVVHYGGQPAPMIGRGGQEGILDLCKRKGIRVIEDAAHAFPARIHGRMVGALGEATCFSFYGNKTITTGEGGMLTTNNSAIARRARIMRLHGIDRDIWHRFTSEKPAWEYDVVAPGFKYNMPDINAAIGLAQLERAWEFHRERQRCAQFYFDSLANIACLDLPVSSVPLKDHAWHLFPIVLKPEAPVSRDRMIELLADRGIGTSVHYKPLHRMAYYKEAYNLSPVDFPNAERIWRGCISLPIFPSLTNEELEYICSTIKDLLG